MNLRQLRPTRRTVCLSLVHKSQLIKNHSDGSDAYVDSFYFCNHFQKKITKKYCHNCTFYKPLDNGKN